MQRLRLAEVIGALSYALDLTEGQPPGHCLRCAAIGMRLADVMDLTATQRWELHYTLLLKDLGCSSNAARICELYLTDDLRFKHDVKLVGGSLPEVVRFVLGHTGLHAGMAERFRAVLEIFQKGGAIADELITTRCQRGAGIARRLRFSEAVAAGIHSLDEHWDGRGRPDHLRGRDIPLYSRVALLSQVVDVFHVAAGEAAAQAEIERRSGTWFDPELADAFRSIARQPGFWETLRDPDLAQRVQAMVPQDLEVPLDEDYLDDIAEGFGAIIDAKSPYTAGHSTRVALYADMIAERLGLEPERRRWMRRGSLLHDLGKLGVSNSILDKPGSLTNEEWAAVRMHAVYTEQILGRITPFSGLAAIAGAHHERLDGKGYPHGRTASQIPLETRIMTVADIFDAISADRPYRAAIPVPQTLDMMSRIVGSAIDGRCLEALREVVRSVDEAMFTPPALSGAAGNE